MDTTSIDEITSDMCDCQYTCWFVLLINFSIRLDSDTVRVENFLQMCGEQRQQPAVDAAAMLLAGSIRRPAATVSSKRAYDSWHPECCLSCDATRHSDLTGQRHCARRGLSADVR